MAKKILSIDNLKNISNSVKKLTHSGSTKIEMYNIKDILDICTTDGGYVEHLFSRLMIMLKENHSEVRLGVVLLCDHFVNSLPLFRRLLVDNLDNYLKYTLGENFDQNLPPPKSAAASVIKLTLKNFNSWYLKYKKDYAKLLLMYNNFVNDKNVDFTAFEIYDPVERAEKEKIISESLKINQALLLKACDEMDDLKDDINNALCTLQMCFDILIPFIGEKDHGRPSSSYDRSESLRAHGIFKPGQNIEINLDSNELTEIKITDENSAVIDNAKEMYNVICKKYLPKTKAWSVLINKVGGNQELLNKTLQMEKRLENEVVKFKKLKFIDSQPIEDDCVSTDSEMEEVEEKEEVKDKLKEVDETEFLKETCAKREKPVRSKVKESFSDRKKELLKIAPKVPFSSDLYHWEDQSISKETLIPTAVDGHKFWASSSIESIEVPAESIRTRVIEFTGEFEPVTRACSAPLPSGKLCPRYDRVKCPFHGPIVPRDDKGNIINPEDEVKVNQFKPKDVVPEWQDPKLLAELKAATGLDLKVGKKKRRNKNPGLTDIKKRESPREKISKKIFKSSTVKRVSKTLDSLDFKRHRDKYRDQFNYFHGT